MLTQSWYWTESVGRPFVYRILPSFRMPQCHRTSPRLGRSFSKVIFRPSQEASCTLSVDCKDVQISVQ